MGKDDTQVYGLGLNYFFKGHANKLSLDFTSVDQETETTSVNDLVNGLFDAMKFLN